MKNFEANTIKIAAAQMEIVTGDYEGNLRRAEEMIAKAAAAKVELICFPEFFASGVAPNPEDQKDKIIDFMIKKANQYKIDIISGTIVGKKDGKIYNTCYYISREGKVIAEYGKTHLFFMEKQMRTPGDRWVVVQTPKAKIGMLICWEAYFPESCRELALQGADIVFCPTWVEDWWGGAAPERRALSIVRAAENQLFFVDVVASGKTIEAFTGQEMKLAGHSRIVGPGPLASVISEAGYEPELLIATLDLNQLREKRNQFQLLKNRRAELYGDISRAAE